MKLLIVNYHYFREETYVAGIYPINQKQFLHQLEALNKHYLFISQQELLQLINSKNKLNKNYCLLTFDDGLKEQMNAFYLLKQKGIPAVFFVPTLPYQNSQVLDVHKVHYIRTVISDAELFNELDQSFELKSYEFNCQQLENQYRYDDETGRKIKYFLNFVLEEEQKRSFIDKIFYSVIGDNKEFLTKTYMSADELKVLAKEGCLGSHGYAHKPLTTLTLPEAAADVKKSVNYLETTTSTAIHGFSYPYGGQFAVSKSLVHIFKETSIKYGLTMWRGINTEADLIPENKFFLKRVDTNDAPGGKFNSTKFEV